MMRNLLFLLLFSPFFTILQAADYCDTALYLGNYITDYDQYIDDGTFSEKDDGTLRLEIGKSFTVPAGKDGLYVDNDFFLRPNSTFIGNIYATGRVAVRRGSEVIGNIYAEGGITFVNGGKITGGDFCENGDVVTLPSYCDNPPDVSRYKLFPGDFKLDDENYQVPDGYDGLYVEGKFELKNNSEFSGNIYAVKDVKIKNTSIFNGNIYSEKKVEEKDQGKIKGYVCENGDPVVLMLDLPVDELIAQCNDIFPDAAQSYTTGSQLFMQNDTQVVDSDTNLFPFSSIAGYHNGSEPPPNSCGGGVQCGITSPPSQALSSFSITANNNGKSFALWSGKIELGGSNEANDLYNGTVFQKVTAGNSSVITFLPLDYSQAEMFQVDTLIIQNTATVKLSAGVYAVQSLKLDNLAKIEVVGDGDVFFFIDSINELNGTIINNSTSRLFFIINDSVEVFQSGTLNASFYSTGDILIGGSLTLSGQVAARNLTLYGSAKIVSNAICGEPPGGNQFVITTQPTALTCEPHPVTLNVLKSDDSPDVDYSGIVDLAVTDSLGNGIGDWSMATDNGRLNNVGSGEATYQFNGDENGEISLLLSVPTVSEVSVSMSQGALAADPKDISFQSSMIKVEQICAIPMAGQCINTANRPFSLTLTAYKSDESKICINYDPDNIAFWSEYVSPNTAALAVDIDQTPIGNTELTAVSIPVEFSAGVATVVANYPDAGKIKIHLKDADIADITGVIETIVNPYKLVIDELTAHERDDELTAHKRDTEDGRIKSTGGFIRASVPNYADLKVDTFDVTAKAIIDCTSTGEVKNCKAVGLNGYKIAPSFNNSVTLLASEVGDYELGTLASEGSLEVSLTGGAFSYQDLAYSEVGSLGLQLESTDYLLAGNTVPVDDMEEVGRFYPDYLAWGSYDFTAACNDFSYLGQQASELSYYLTAYNQATSPSATENYDKNRGYPVAPTDNFEHYAFAGTTDLTSRLLADDYYDEDNWLLGIYTVSSQIVGIDRITNAPDGPYFIDGDASEYWVELMGIDGEKIDSTTDCSGDRCLLGDLGDLVYGRLQASNGHGSEFQSIRTLIEASYFDGNQFVPFKGDDCTTVVTTQVETETIAGSDNDISTKANLSISNSPLISGHSYFDFSAPQERGKFNYFIDLHTTAPWLLDSGNEVECKDASAGLNDCISGYVEFGLFRGNDRIIYRMQTFD